MHVFIHLYSSEITDRINTTIKKSEQDKLCSVEHGVCRIFFLPYRPYNNFIVRRRLPNFRHHGNKGQSTANFSDIIKFSALKDPCLVQDSPLCLTTQTTQRTFARTNLLRTCYGETGVMDFD